MSMALSRLNPETLLEAVGGVDGAKSVRAGAVTGLSSPSACNWRGEDEPFPLNTPVAVVGTTLLSRRVKKVR